MMTAGSKLVKGRDAQNCSRKANKWPCDTLRGEQVYQSISCGWARVPQQLMDSGRSLCYNKFVCFEGATRLFIGFAATVISVIGAERDILTLLLLGTFSPAVGV